MKNNHEEIYDQAGFFSSVWSQLPEEFKKDAPRYGEVTESYEMIIWDCSSTVKTCSHCKSTKLISDGVFVECQNCGKIECEIID